MENLTFAGDWLDMDKNTITITPDGDNKATLLYGSGRGPFTGEIYQLGSPVISVDFYDGPQWDAGQQAGLLDHKNDTITWSNATVWTRIVK